MNEHDEIRLTAYALDELDPAQRAEVEAFITGHLDAQQYVAAVRHTAGLLEQQFEVEPQLPSLSEEHKMKIEEQLNKPKTQRRTRLAWSIGITAGATAAAVLVVMVSLPPLGSARRSTDQISKEVQQARGAKRDRLERSNALALATDEQTAVRSTSVDRKSHPTSIQKPGTPTVRGLSGERQREHDGGKTNVPVVDRLNGVAGFVKPKTSNESNATPQQRRELARAKQAEYMQAKRIVDRRRNKQLSSAQTSTREQVNFFNAGWYSKQRSAGRTRQNQPFTLGDVASSELGNRRRGAAFKSGRLFGLKSDGDSVLVGHLPGRNNPNFNTEAYDHIADNPFMVSLDNPLSTFSIDVDTASYANMRRFITQQHQLPPKDAVRIEELINYFVYDYKAPPVWFERDGIVDSKNPHIPQPFNVHTQVTTCPWATGHQLVKIGLKGAQLPAEAWPAGNLVFLLDVSGSMGSQNKLPLLRQAMKMLVNELRQSDQVAIVVYAGASGLVLDSTPVSNKQAIIEAIDRLKSGGSTNGGQGIELAYRVATENFIEGGNNRVILCTDGDFNVGITDRGALTRLIEQKAKSGVYLSLLGFGMGNLKDATMEQLSNKGDGNYAYIDSINEARKVLIEQMGGTLVTIAKDVKIQVEFNPAKVRSYRLIGYENRILSKEDFNDDTVDAGDIGAGHTVTALYEIVPNDGEVKPATTRSVNPTKYMTTKQLTDAAGSNELLTVNLRYKAPDAPKQQGTSKLISHVVQNEVVSLQNASPDMRFAAAVASFGMILRDSPHKGDATFATVLDLAQSGITAQNDKHGYRREFIKLVNTARAIGTPQVQIER